MSSSSPFKFSMKFTGSGGGGGSSSTPKRKREVVEATPKKHRSSEFCRSSNTGVVSKLDSGAVRTLVRDSNVVIRPLGDRVETFSSQQTVYVESAVEDDLIGGLKNKVTQLEDLVARLERRLESDKQNLEKRLEATEQELERSGMFLHQGMANALRAFSDLILSAFFKACGKENVGFQERAAWLADSSVNGAYVYLTRHEVTFQLFGVDATVGKKDLRLIRSLRKASSDVSSSVSHSATPIEVATALEQEGANVFGGDLKSVSNLFQSLFSITWKKMVKDWRDGNRNKEFQKKFKPPRPPQI